MEGGPKKLEVKLNLGTKSDSVQTSLLGLKPGKVRAPEHTPGSTKSLALSTPETQDGSEIILSFN